MEKLQINKEKEEDDSETSSEIDSALSSQYDEEEEDEDSEHNVKTDKSSEISSDVSGNKRLAVKIMANKNVNVFSKEDYYHVNLTKIKFSVYDYKKKGFVDKSFDKRAKINK